MHVPVYGLLGDLIVVLHLSFVLFVLFGGLVAFWKPRIVWLHLPALAWGTAVEFSGWICPLTPLEQRLRSKAGTPAYDSDFIGQYVFPLLYPTTLTSDVQFIMGLIVVVVNGTIYGWLLWSTRRGY